MELIQYPDPEVAAGQEHEEIIMGKWIALPGYKAHKQHDADGEKLGQCMEQQKIMNTDKGKENGDRDWQHKGPARTKCSYLFQ